MQRLISFLTGNPELRTMTQQAGQLAALERAYRASIPRTLALASHIAGLDHNNLIIAAENGGIAAKLRQLVPHILKIIQENRPEITGIVVKVQVGGQAEPAQRSPHILSDSGKADIGKLAASLSDSPLKRALQRLTRR